MFTHCVHCQSELGANDLLEAFPVGRRVAFDAAKGRLWVVCPKCERWNLAPFDTRWEAIEQAERAYRDTRVRLATDNIGLAKWRDGTTLVRVGRPLRPEFAAWRYGDQFGRRRRRRWITGGLAAAGGAALIGGAAASGAGLLLLSPLMNVMSVAAAAHTSRQRMIPLAHPDGKWFLPAGNPRLIGGTRGPGDWAIEIGWLRRLDQPRMTLRSFFGKGNNIENGRVILNDALARDALAKLLPSVNGSGAPPARVQDAVHLLDEAGGPDQIMSWAVTQRGAWAARQHFGDTGDLGFIPKPARLAIEMAVHEERERLALLGELAELERAWLEADAIAAIADGLLVPPEVERRLQALRAATRTGRQGGGAGSSESATRAP